MFTSRGGKVVFCSLPHGELESRFGNVRRSCSLRIADRRKWFERASHGAVLAMRSSTERTLYNRQEAPGNHLERTCHISYASRDPICSVTTRNLKANLQTGQQAKEPSIAPDPFTRASPEDSNPQLGLWLCPSPSREAKPRPLDGL